MKEKKLLAILRDTEIKIERALSVTLDKRWGFTSMGAHCNRIYIVGKGGGFLQKDGQRVEMKEGNVYFIPANCPFSCGCDYMEKIFFHVCVSTLEKYDLFSGLDTIYSLPFSMDEYHTLKEMLLSESYFDILEIKSRVVKIILDFCHSFNFDFLDVKKYSELVSAIIDYVEKNTRIDLSISDISKEFFVSESKIRSSFKAEMGIPLGKYIDDMVFIKAMQLLANKELSIAHVSSQLGFCDQFYLSRRFKEKYGVTPGEFKRKNAF